MHRHLGWIASLALAALAAAEERAFVPAFTEEVVDLAACRQYANGKAAPAEPERVKRALGFFGAAGNWEEVVWEVGGADGAETVCQFLVVFKQPVEIGTLSVSPADVGPPKGSATGGELFYLKDAVPGVPDPARGAAWTKAEFASPAQHLRFCTLPPGTRTRALLYRDVRVRGAARLLYLNAYRNRLQDITPGAAGSCEPADGSAEPDGLPLGRGWSASPKGGIGDKTPVRYTLLWEEPQRLNGLFLYSNAEKFRVLACDARGGDPLAAPASAWKPVATTADRDNKHSFKHWAYSYRWLTFPALETKALRVEVTRVERGGAALWISGLAAMTILGDRPPIVLKAREAGPPFRFAAQFPLSGDAALAIEDAKGRRVRDLFAQTFRAQGRADEPWDLRDEGGALVAPGQYAWKAIVGPQLALRYGIAPYPNLQNFFPERMPWLVGHSGEHGWLSDHANNWACATAGDRVYFAAPMAEAGTTLIECDLEGRRLWGQHDFGAWIGVNQMAADAESLFVLAGDDKVHRLELATRKDANQFLPKQGPTRRGWRSAMAARDGKVVFTYTGEPLFDNAATADALDLKRCLPVPPDRSLVQLLRIEGEPPGGDVDAQSDKPQGNGHLYLESEPLGKKGDDKDDLLHDPADARRVAVIAFRQPVPLGSILFPWPAGEGKLQIAALKPDAPYPPRPERNEDWTPFPSSGGPGWNCVPAPPRPTTRAIRILFEPKGEKSPFWRLEGLRLLSRRFASLFASARVRVNSGKVSPAGEWDAARTTAVAPDRPGIYVMDWPAPQKLCGLAIKEIDGAVAEIDVWQGPAPGDVPLDGVAHERKSKEPGWRNVATYTQKRRVSDYVGNYNAHACYMDGTVDFGQTVETRAVRLRITEQWLDNGPGGGLCRRHDGRSEHGVHRKQSYCLWLDSRVCKLMGVAPLSPLGDDPPLDPLTYERLEVWDGKAGKLLKELPVRPGWHGLSFAPDGALYVIEKSHEVISRVDMETGSLTPVVRDADPSVFTIGPDGLFYIYSWGDECRRPILVYDAQGRKLREIGKPGGFRPGLWDPQRFGKVHRMCVDKAGSLWVLESQDNPRRIVQYKTDGALGKELLGNTHYGGGGTLDRTNPSRAFHGGVEFQLDWAKHTSRVRAFFGDGFLGGDPVVRRCNGRLYIATAPLSLHDRQGTGVVYLYDEKEGTVRLAAAMGDATGFAPLRRSDIISLLPGGEVLLGYEFLWCDRNGNGGVDADEVSFQKTKGHVAVGPFDESLGCVGNGVFYEVAEFLPSGVPAYGRSPAPGWPHLRLKDGNWLTLHGQSKPGGRSENFVVAPDGAKRWGYPASGGVSGLSIPGWQPGLVTNQFGIIGHETAPAGDLGEFFVVHDNTGQWRLWTADGLLAGNVLYHKADPRSRFFGPPDAKFGARLDPLSANQEHFHGFFTRTEPDNRYFAVAGFTHMSILEVEGIEKFRRSVGTLAVSAEDIERVRRWEAERARRRGGKAAVLIARNVEGHAPVVDGRLAPDEWGDALTLPSNPGVTFRLAYDSKSLYLCWTGKGAGPLANDGSDVRRLFKTGACLDFHLGADDKADPKRTAPAKGDQRLLIAFVSRKPRVVLYQPVAPGAAPAEAWSTHTEAGGTTRFDRVVVLDKDVAIAMAGDRDFTVEAAIPLKVLGLAPRAGLRLRGDWGILPSDDGRQVKARAYWSNVTATGTADEAVEARLEPHFWGRIVFDADPEASKRGPRLPGEGPEGAGPGDALDELEKP